MFFLKVKHEVLSTNILIKYLSYYYISFNVKSILVRQASAIDFLPIWKITWNCSAQNRSAALTGPPSICSYRFNRSKYLSSLTRTRTSCFWAWLKLRVSTCEPYAPCWKYPRHSPNHRPPPGPSSAKPRTYFYHYFCYLFRICT